MVMLIVYLMHTQYKKWQPISQKKHKIFLLHMKLKTSNCVAIPVNIGMKTRFHYPNSLHHNNISS